MANLSPSLHFCSLPFHKALPKSFPISSYNFVRLRHRHFHTVFASSSLKKTGTTRKVMDNADLCKNIREFVSSFGFPEGHVPSLKELSQHGRQDLANIVRRRGYKMITDLLATSAQTDKNEFNTKESFTSKQGEKVKDIADDIVKDVESESSEVVKDSTTDILLQNESHGMGDVVEDVSSNSEISGLESNLLHGGNEASVVVSSNSEKEGDVKNYALHIEHDEVGDVKNYALHIEHDEVEDVAKEYLRNETGEQEDFSKDVSNLLSVKDEVGIELEDFSSQTTKVDSFLESNTSNEVGVINNDISSYCEYEEPADIVRDLFSLQTENNEVGAAANITSLKNEDDIGICETEVSIDVFSGCHQDLEKDVVEDVSKDIFFHSENVPEDIHMDSGNPLDEEKISNANGVKFDISSDSESISKSPNDAWLKDNVRKFFQDGELKENEIAAKDAHSEIVARLEPPSYDAENEITQVPKVVNGIASSARDLNVLDESTSHPQRWWYNQSSTQQQKSGGEVDQTEFEHLRFMLRTKELELTKLKKLIESEQHALSTLQSETEIKIKEAQQLILEKDAELQAAEETLSDLQEVEIQFHVDGEGVELAGSFNGWHHRVKMDRSSASETSKLRTGLWTTVLWLYPGLYEIKFIVDGYWRIDPDREVLTRGHIQNNILKVGKK